MADLGSCAIRPRAIRLPEAAWGPGVDGLTGERMFTWTVDGRPVSRRYRATRHVTLVHEAGVRRLALADGVGGLVTEKADRRHGHGSALMMKSIDASFRDGYTLGLLCCLPALEPWYRRLGWWLTRDVQVLYRNRRGDQVSLSAPALWTGVIALGPQPEFSTLTRIEINGPLW